MKKITLLFVYLLVSLSLYAQTGNYYVSSRTLNLRQSSDKTSEIVTKLSQYDNLKVVEVTENWAQVQFEDKTGYVWKAYLKPGEAIVSYYGVRTGARCKDGSYSSATGRGACSHHGGVANWIRKSQKSVSIEND